MIEIERKFLIKDGDTLRAKLSTARKLVRDIYLQKTLSHAEFV